MKVIHTKDAIAVEGLGFISHRILLAKDGMGFSLHKTVIPTGEPRHWHYKEHLEACYCVSGLGILKNISTGQEYEIKPDVTYVLDSHDPHTFQALQDTVLISVFNPPVTGDEIHGEDGSYLLPRNMNRGKATQIVKAVNSTCNEYDATDMVQDILNGKLDIKA